MILHKLRNLARIERDLFLMSDGMDVQISHIQWLLSPGIKHTLTENDVKVKEAVLRFLIDKKEQIDRIRKLF